MENHIFDKDKRVKVLLDGTPVVNSTLQSQYAKFLNFKNRFTAIANGNNYDIDFKYADQILTKLNGVQVGTQPRYLNFSSDFTDVETVATNSYDIGYKFKGLSLVQNNGADVNTVPKKINFGNNLTPTEGANAITVDAPTPPTPYSNYPGSTSGYKPNGWLTGHAGGNSSQTAIIRAGNGIFANWNMEHNVVPKVDATNGSYHDWVTDNVTAAAVAYSSDDSGSTFIRKFNPWIEIYFSIPVITSIRMYMGFADTLPLPNNAFNFLNGRNGFGIRFDDGQDSTWKIMYNTGLSTNPTPIDSGVTVTANSLYIIKIFADETNTRWGVTIKKDTATPVTAYVTQATGSPGSTAPVGYSSRFTTQEAVTKHMSVWYHYGETDR